MFFLAREAEQWELIVFRKAHSQRKSIRITRLLVIVRAVIEVSLRNVTFLIYKDYR